jgi:hypothetical protein
MRAQIVNCNRCGGRIEADIHLVRVESGSLRHCFADTDLCGSCAREFQQWLHAGSSAELPADVPAPPGWPPRAGRSAEPADFQEVRS